MVEINPRDYVLVRDRGSNLYLAKGRSLFDLNANDQIRRSQERNGFASTTKDFVDFVLLLDSKRRVYDGRGKLVSTVERRRLLDEAIGKRNPWREENLDNRFFEYQGNLFLVSRHRVINGKITPLIVKEISPLLQDGYINLKDLDEDGLATKVSASGSIFYSYPRPNSVARFGADSGRVGLYCGGDPGDSIADLGVREARENFEV